MRSPTTSGPQSVTTLSLLRGIYAASLNEGRASATTLGKMLDAPRATLTAALKEASAKGLVRSTGGVALLTPSGRRRLKVVMLGGAFEIIHPGHIHALSEAKSLGNTLVVVVATDESVQRNKGRPPATGQSSRVALVASLRQVDMAVPGNKGSIYDILVRIRPDVVALGYDQRHGSEEIVREAAKRGVKITIARLGSPIPDVKTSKILLSL